MQAQGGWSQRRCQARVDERVEAFARDVAEATRRELVTYRVYSLILTVGEVVGPALESTFHESVLDKIDGLLPLDVRTSESDVNEATRPIAEEVERELEAVRQVETFVMVDEFEGKGRADDSIPACANGDVPTSRPLGGIRAIMSASISARRGRGSLSSQAPASSSCTPISRSARNRSRRFPRRAETSRGARR